MGFLLLAGIAFSVHYLFYSHQFLQHSADNLATSLAVNMNSNDRIGQMNNLVANSRELVFNSRSSYQHASDEFPLMTDLADRLLLESREGADMVERARRDLVALIVQDVQTSAKAASKSGLGQGTTLPWARSSEAELQGMQIGNIKNVESNVMAPYGNDPLLKLDTKSGYIDLATHLYYGRTIIKLPDDPDKKFHLTSLAAPVQGNVAPPRLTEAQMFDKTAELLKDGQPILGICDELPTAVQVRLNMDVTNQVAVKSTHGASVDATAATAGANPVNPTP
jgi:hypothetical protein